MDSTIADCRKQRKTSSANDPVFDQAKAAWSGVRALCYQTRSRERSRHL